MQNKTMGTREWITLIVLSLLWGGSFMFNGIAVKELPPVTIVAVRVALAALALLTVLRVAGIALPRGRQVWAAFFVMGILNNVVPFSLIVWGQTAIAGGLASILNATTPLFTVLVAHMLTVDEKLTANRLAGVVVGFSGVAFMVGPAAFSGLGDNILPQLAVLAAAFSYALSGIYGRRFPRMGIAPLPTAAGQLSASAFMLVPLALVFDQPWMLPVPAVSTWLAMIGLALLSTALAYILFFRILASAGATNLALVTFLIPVSAIFLGALVLGERLEPQHFGGMALIAVGLALIDGRVVTAIRGKN